jgi:hypothetical protein
MQSMRIEREPRVVTATDPARGMLPGAYQEGD